MAVYGAGGEADWQGGLVALETGYYRTRDSERPDRILPGDELRWLLRYQRPWSLQWTAAVQFDGRTMRDGVSCAGRQPAGEQRERTRHCFGMGGRLTWRDLAGRRNFTLFTRYSPTANQGVLRTEVSQVVHTAWKLTAGAVGFFGTQEYPLYSLTEKDSHLFFAVQRSL